MDIKRPIFFTKMISEGCELRPWIKQECYDVTAALTLSLGLNSLFPSTWQIFYHKQGMIKTITWKLMGIQVHSNIDHNLSPN